MTPGEMAGQVWSAPCRFGLTDERQPYTVQPDGDYSGVEVRAIVDVVPVKGLSEPYILFRRTWRVEDDGEVSEFGNPAIRTCGRSSFRRWSRRYRAALRALQDAAPDGGAA